MAKTLMEVVRERLQKPQSGLPSQPLGQSEAVQGILSTKSGKAVSSRGPKSSSLGEASAAQQTQQALEQVGQRGELLGQQQEGQQLEQEQTASQQQASLEQSQAEAQAEIRNRTESLFNELEQEGKKLDLQKDASKLEQLGFLVAIQDSNYVNGLQREYKDRQLNDDINFKEALQASVFSDMQELMRSDLEFQEALAADSRSFNKKVAQIDLDTAMRMATEQARAENQRSMYEGLGTLITTGVDLLDKSTKNKTDKSTPVAPTTVPTSSMRERIGQK